MANTAQALHQLSLKGCALHGAAPRREGESSIMVWWQHPSAHRLQSAEPALAHLQRAASDIQIIARQPPWVAMCSRKGSRSDRLTLRARGVHCISQGALCVGNARFPLAAGAVGS